MWAGGGGGGLFVCFLDSWKHSRDCKDVNDSHLPPAGCVSSSDFGIPCRQALLARVSPVCIA